MIRHAHEIDPRVAVALARNAARARPVTTRPHDEASEKKRDTMRANRVLVRGRFTMRGALVWDVLKLEGEKLTVYASGCAFRDEALELAVQCLSGRVFTSLSGVRTLLEARAGMLVPSRVVGFERQGVTLKSLDGKKPEHATTIEVVRT